MNEISRLKYSLVSLAICQVLLMLSNLISQFRAFIIVISVIQFAMGAGIAVRNHTATRIDLSMPAFIESEKNDNETRRVNRTELSMIAGQLVGIFSSCFLCYIGGVYLVFGL